MCIPICMNNSNSIHKLIHLDKILSSMKFLIRCHKCLKYPLLTHFLLYYNRRVTKMAFMLLQCHPMPIECMHNSQKNKHQEIEKRKNHIVILKIQDCMRHLIQIARVPTIIIWKLLQTTKIALKTNPHILQFDKIIFRSRLKMKKCQVRMKRPAKYQQFNNKNMIIMVQNLIKG